MGETDMGGDVVDEDVLSAEEWGAEYAKLRLRYEDLASRLQVLLSQFLAAEGIDIVQIEHRAKTSDSVVEKIKRKNRDERQPLETITDLVGLRIICYYLEDVTAVADVVEREFLIDRSNSLDKVSELALDQFGYRSSHYVATIRPARASMLEWKQFEHLKFEVQIRTVLQHAWASVSHKIDYKVDAEATPDALRRRLHRLSALFEIADEQFSSLRAESRAQDVANQVEVAEGNLSIALDASSYAAYLGITGTGEKLQKLLARAGFETEVDNSVSEARLTRDRDDLIGVLRHNKIENLRQLAGYLADSAKLERLAKMVVEGLGRGDGIRCSVDDALAQIVLVDPIMTFKGDVYAAHWGDRLHKLRLDHLGSDASA